MRLGQWGQKMNTNEYQAFIEGCLALGLNDFDHADIYGHYTTEAEFGAVLKNNSSLRSKLQITTKCGIKLTAENRPVHTIKSYDSSKDHILASVENSLRDLHTDYIDVLLIHRPDVLLNPREVAEAFNQLQAQGKVKYFGVSNFSPSQFEMLHTFVPLITNQVEASITHLNPFFDGTFDQSLQLGLRPTIWSPFGGGDIFTYQEKNKKILAATKPLMEKYNITLDQLLLAWLFKHPARLIPVLGTSRLERVEAAKEALNVEITHEEWYELLEASRGEEVA